MNLVKRTQNVYETLISFLAYECNERAKLTLEQVREIRVLLKENKLSQRAIAEKFDVSRRTVGFISRGERWASTQVI